MFVTIAFAVLLLVTLVALFVVLINAIRLLVRVLRKKDKAKMPRKILHSGIAVVAALVLCVGFTLVTQLAASTPPVEGENAIAELREVTLNGRKEWISIRGQNKTNPVLLFLAGGPGGSQMAAVRYELAALEEHFVVVNWDQPGSAKSYGAMSIKDMAPEVYIEDGVALTEYLCEEFGQEKITLLGESWGSALGIFLVDRAPELYHRFIGTGQMVSFLDTELMNYEFAMQLARENGDTETLETLRANGKPPYYGNDITWKILPYNQYGQTFMAQNPEITNGGYNTFRDIFSSEYGMLDKINFFRGMLDVMNSVYPQLYDVDLRKEYHTLAVPVYFFLGRYDINAPTSLVEDYYAILSAPEKEIVWFEHSGHSPWMNEADLFVSEVLRVAGVTPPQ